ncbi:MAG: tyrosine-type recombinase/integrase [Bdellovibrionota bacterium]
MKTKKRERAVPKVIPSFAKLVKGYVGFLQGTGKSLSTIASYKGDLSLLETFLGERKKDFYQLNAKDFAAYEYWMEKQGLKMNTRRRKILSAKSLVRYAVSRKKVAASSVQFVKTPERLERLPWIPSSSDYSKLLEFVKGETPLSLRNRLIVSLLAETGLSLAEVCALRWDQISGDKLAAGVGSKKPRSISLSEKTVVGLDEWRKANSGKHLFPGFNRHGVTSEKMTPRGVELFFRHLSKATGFRSLKPKTLRHYCITTWLRADLPENEIQRRLGVHPNYSLQPYRKFLERAPN